MNKVGVKLLLIWKNVLCFFQERNVHASLDVLACINAISSRKIILPIALNTSSPLIKHDGGSIMMWGMILELETRKSWKKISVLCFSS